MFSFHHGPWSTHERAGNQLCGKEDESVQWWFLLEVIECGFGALWFGWWKKWVTVL
jgi:hypothetical protein